MRKYDSIFLLKHILIIWDRVKEHYPPASLNFQSRYCWWELSEVHTRSDEACISTRIVLKPGTEQNGTNGMNGTVVFHQRNR